MYAPAYRRRSPAQRLDGALQNALTGLGLPGVDVAEATHRQSVEMTTTAARREYRGSWAARREVDRPADDLIPSEGDWTITDLPEGMSEADVKSYLAQVGSTSPYPEDHGALNILGNLHACSHMLGGGAAVMLIEDGLPASEPIDFSRIQGLRGIEVLERDEITPCRVKANGAPEFYIIGSSRTEISSSAIVHASRVIPSRGNRLSPRDEWHNQGWGASVLEATKTPRDAMHVANQELGSMALKTVQDIVLISELNESICQPNGEASIDQRVALMARSRGQHKVMVLDGGKLANGNERGRAPDQYITASRDARGMSDLGDALSRTWAGSTGQTESIALGKTPGGMNTGTNAGDWQSWGSHIEGVWNRWLVARLRTILDVVFAAKDGPTGGEVPDKYGLKRANLWSPTEMDRASVRASNAATDNIYQLMGAITPEQISQQRFVEGNDGALSLDASAGQLPPDLLTGAPEELPEPEPDALDLAWSDAQPPDDASVAKDIGEQLGITAQLVHRIARDQELPAYPKPGYPKVPLYSLRDIKRAVLRRQGVDVESLEQQQDAKPKRSWWRRWRR